MSSGSGPSHTRSAATSRDRISRNRSRPPFSSGRCSDSGWRPPRWLVLIASFVVVTSAITLTAALDAGPAGAWTDGACPTAAGVTVVVDFQQLGGGVQVRCAPGGPSSGFDALDRAGITWTPTVRFPGFLCRIDGLPSNDPCQSTPPTTAYWSYWNATRGGSWCYGNFGAGGRTPPEGTVEGWSFSLDRSSTSAPQPRIPPPAWVPGAPTSMVDSTCASTPVTAPQGTAPPTTGVTPGPSTSGRGPAAGSVAPAGAGSTTNVPGVAVQGRTVEGASVEPGPGTATTADPEVGAPTGGADSGAASTTPTTAPPTSTRPARDEVAAASGRSSRPTSGGTVAGLVAAALIVLALTATSAVVRRRATPAE